MSNAFALLAVLGLVACSDGTSKKLTTSEEQLEQTTRGEALQLGHDIEGIFATSRFHWLSAFKDGGQDEADTYYNNIIPGRTPNYQLSDWKNQFIGSLPTYTAFYRNANELGFWRDMTCTREIKRGVGGCMVTNYANERDRANFNLNKGTVAMNVSPEGITRFYVFVNQQGTGIPLLSTTAKLDDEGDKFVPRLCVVCHGGSSNVALSGTNYDIGGVFREFQPSQLDKRSGITALQAEQEWYNLNAYSITTANLWVRGKDEGAPRGVDAARAHINELIGNLYPNPGPPARSVNDIVLVPTSWRDNGVNQALYQNMVGPYCAACHRHLPAADEDSDKKLYWDKYSEFEFMRQGVPGGDPTPLLRLVTAAQNQHRSDIIYMPQAQLTFVNLSGGQFGDQFIGPDSTAQAAIDGWLCISGDACTTNPNHECRNGKTICGGAQQSCQDGDPKPNGTACGEGNSGVCQNGSCVANECRTSVLVLADGDASAYDLADDLRQDGMVPTLILDGAFTYSGSPQASSFGVVVVTSGESFGKDMPAAGQQSIATAAAGTTGVVFTEWAADQVASGLFRTLAPLVLLSDGEDVHGPLDFSLEVPDHPIWDGLPTQFTTVFATAANGSKSVVNGGTRIAGLSTGDVGVAVREGRARRVHINHSADFPGFKDPWFNDANLSQMMDNAVRWAAHCK